MAAADPGGALPPRVSRARRLTAVNRAWLEQLSLPAAREQITVALAMIDAVDVRVAPLDKELRAYARRQAGCRALQAAHYGIGALTSVVILAETRRDAPVSPCEAACWRTISSSTPSRQRGLGTSSAAGGFAGAARLHAQARRGCAAPGLPDRLHYQRRAAARREPRVRRLLASCPRTQRLHPPRARRRGARARVRRTFRARHASCRPMHRGRLPALRCRHVRVDGLQRLSGRNCFTQREQHPHQPSCRCRGSNPRSRDRDLLFHARAHTVPQRQHRHRPRPRRRRWRTITTTPETRLTRRQPTRKLRHTDTVRRLHDSATPRSSASAAEGRRRRGNRDWRSSGRGCPRPETCFAISAVRVTLSPERGHVWPRRDARPLSTV